MNYNYKNYQNQQYFFSKFSATPLKIPSFQAPYLPAIHHQLVSIFVSAPLCQLVVISLRSEYWSFFYCSCFPTFWNKEFSKFSEFSKISPSIFLNIFFDFCLSSPPCLSLQFFRLLCYSYHHIPIFLFFFKDLIVETFSPIYSNILLKFSHCFLIFLFSPPVYFQKYSLVFLLCFLLFAR